MEFQKDNSFITGRIKSVSYAVKGMFKLVTTEHSVMVQTFLSLVMVGAGFAMHISREEWIMQTFACGMVIAIESLNTAVEKIADFIHPEFHEKIGFIKDIAAGAVMFAATTAIIIGLLIYVPKFT